MISFVHFITFMALAMAVIFYLVAVLKTCVGHIGGECDPVKTFINVFIVLMIVRLIHSSIILSLPPFSQTFKCPIWMCRLTCPRVCRPRSLRASPSAPR